MRRDRIAILIAVVIILTCLSNIKVNARLERKIGNKLNDPWIRLVKPVDGEEVYKKIVCESLVSNPEEIYCVMYYFAYNGVWHGDTTWSAYEPPYHFEYCINFLKPGDEVIVAAASYIEIWTPTSRVLKPIAVSEDVRVIVRDNNKPLKPSTPLGPSVGKIKTEYIYRSSAIDLDGDYLYYLFDWGDGTNSDWLGPYKSGETIEAKHVWNEENKYTIKVKAKDIYDFESEWSDPSSVIIIKTREKESFNKSFLEFRYLKDHDLFLLESVLEALIKDLMNGISNNIFPKIIIIPKNSSTSKPLYPVKKPL